MTNLTTLCESLTATVSYRLNCLTYNMLLKTMKKVGSVRLTGNLNDFAQCSKGFKLQCLSKLFESSPQYY